MPADDDDDDARARGRFDGLHERVGRRRLVRRMAERHVDDVDAERRLVRRGELDRGDDVARRSAAGVVEHPEADQVRIRRDALILAAGQRAAARDQAGDVRAVAVAVDRRRRDAALAVGEVVERGDAAREIGDRRDARIDDRDADAVAARIELGQPENRAQKSQRPEISTASCPFRPCCRRILMPCSLKSLGSDASSRPSGLTMTRTVPVDRPVRSISSIWRSWRGFFPCEDAPFTANMTGAWSSTRTAMTDHVRGLNRLALNPDSSAQLNNSVRACASSAHKMGA